jgi:hypothetical protein
MAMSGCKDCVRYEFEIVPDLVSQLEAADGDNENLARVLRDVEGSLLAYWTDIPEAEIQRLLGRIRESYSAAVVGTEEQQPQ